MERAALVLPSEIPWEELSGEALEELLFWLCDAMGAKDLQWRVGSTSGPSSDRGRDIQAVFNVPSPDGELVPQTWWIQAKGRSKTVEPDAVKGAAVDAQSDSPDVLVIATNSRYSNPTRDWLAEFQAKHPRPDVRLWDRESLERLVVRNPSVVLRSIPQALSPQGQVEAAATRFWDRLEYPNANLLDPLWSNRGDVDLDWRALWALVAAEAAAGDLSHRSWGPAVEEKVLSDALVLGFANLLGWIVRAQETGISDDPAYEAAEYILASALLRLPTDFVVDVAKNPWRHVEPTDGASGKWDPEGMQSAADLLLKPIVGRLRSRLGDACVSDCVRIDADIDPPDRVDASGLWIQFLLDAEGVADPQEPDTGQLIMEKLSAPCNAGLDLGKDRHCPLFMGASRPWEETFPLYAEILRNRVEAYDAETSA
jgi:hypothetical protein